MSEDSTAWRSRESAWSFATAVATVYGQQDIGPKSLNHIQDLIPFDTTLSDTRANGTAQHLPSMLAGQHTEEVWTCA